MGREFGRAFLTVTEECALFDGLWKVGERHQVWMSHGDKVTEFAPGFGIVAVSDGAPFAVIANRRAALTTARQFHPEVHHTPEAARLIANFVRHTSAAAPATGPWPPIASRRSPTSAPRWQTARSSAGFRAGSTARSRQCLIHEAVGEQLTCVFVDHGLMRANEAEQVVSLFRGTFNIPLVHVDAEELFLSGLAGVTDPEAKRKFIGKTFIDVFDEEARKIGGADFLAQGTLYPDVIESVSFTGGPSVTIKSHHNVGRPARADEHEAGRALARIIQGRGRELGRELGLPEAFVGRHPFPGPGLAIRIPGEGRENANPAPGRRGLPRGNPERGPV